VDSQELSDPAARRCTAAAGFLSRKKLQRIRTAKQQMKTGPCTRQHLLLCCSAVLLF
jgi:hypothetical protein